MFTEPSSTYIVEAIDSGSGVTWSEVAPGRKRLMAILLSDLRSGATCLLVEVEDATVEPKPVCWRSIVSVWIATGKDNRDARDDVASANTVDGEYISFRWWAID